VVLADLVHAELTGKGNLDLNRLRDLLVDGVLLALPLGAAAFLVYKVLGLLLKVLAPASHLFPNARWFGIGAIDLAAFALLVVALIALGAFARSAPGRRVAGTLESLVLAKIPGYLIAKSVAAGFSSDDRDTGLRPALVSFDDNTVLGFVVEVSEAADSLTVFVPSAPGAASGSVVLVPKERVRFLDAPTSSAMKTMKQRGLGLQQLVRDSKEKS
jgi:uncharacterized membrane protein